MIKILTDTAGNLEALRGGLADGRRVAHRSVQSDRLRDTIVVVLSESTMSWLGEMRMPSGPIDAANDPAKNNSKDPPFILQPWLFVVCCLSGWVQEELQKAVEYLQVENKVLREEIGTKRILLSDDQRRRLAVKGKELGRKKLREIGSLFCPDTILAWHRRLVANHHTYQQGNQGRPKLADEVVALVVKLAQENSTWGCDRIQGEMEKLGHVLSDTSIENILKKNGIEPAPERKRDGGSWKEFLAAHWDCLGATDFTSVDVWTPTGLKTFYLLFVMELKSRKVQYLGCTTHPNEVWMMEAVQRATADDGILGGESHPTILLMDRDTKFTAKFQEELKSKNVKPHLLPPRSPNLNAYMERFMLTYKSECARRMIFFGKTMLDHATTTFLKHYHEERPHQGLDNELIIPLDKPPDPNAEIEVTKRLGGLLKSYRRKAA